MSVAIKQIRVYVRGALVVLVALAIMLVLFKNRSHAVQFWFFGLTDGTKPINVVWLLLCTAVATLITWWIILLAWRLVREVRAIQRERAIAHVSTAIERRAAELDERERRIDKKVQKAITDNDDKEDDEVGE